MNCADIKSQHIIEFVTQLGASVKPQTASTYVSHLSSIFQLARPAWGYPLDYQAIKDAQLVGRKMGLTAKSDARDRRPTLCELDRILTHFDKRKSRQSAVIPMQNIILAAIFLTRRLEELTLLRWTDLDIANNRILVRDMKHPGAKAGNNIYCNISFPGMQIINTFKKQHDRIMPFNHRSISSTFTWACKTLDIKDLRFHDLRHDGISRLFEMGKTIPQVATVSGHRSWQSLSRYTHILQSGDKYEDWPWIKRLGKLEESSSSTENRCLSS